MRFILALFLMSSITYAQELKVGVIAGFSGLGADYGAAFRSGISLAQEALPSAQVRYIYEDDQFTPKLTVTAFRKLAEIDKVDAIIIGDTTTSKSVAGLAQRYNIPLLVWASEDPAFQNNPLIFRTWPTMEKEIQLVQEEVKNEKLSNIAIWSGPHDYAVTYARALKKALANDVVAYQEFSENLGDYRSLLAGLAKKGVKAINLCLTTGENGHVVRQMKDLHLNLAIFGCAFLNYGREADTLRLANRTAWVFDAVVTDAFKKRYQEKKGDPVTMNAAAVFYDSALAIGHAQLNRSPNQSLSDALRTIGTIEGANGRFKLGTANQQQFFDFQLSRVSLP